VEERECAAFPPDVACGYLSLSAAVVGDPASKPADSTPSLYIEHGKVSIRNVHAFIHNTGRGQLSSE